VLQERGMVRKMRPHEHAPKQKGEEEAPHHKHGEYDPHVWLGIDEAAVMVGVIRDTLCEVDPGHADEYRENAAAYVARLEALKADGRKRIEAKKVRRIISFHDAFEYYSRSFGLEVAAVIEMSPNVAPTGRHLTQLEKLCRE